MTPLREWLKPARTLLLLLFLLTLVSVSALAWFGWKLQDQERMVNAQRTQERIEQAAGRIAATLRGTLAETGDRLAYEAAASGPAHNLPEEGLLLRIGASSLECPPPGRLLYYPYPPGAPEARPELFAEAEALEFQQGQPGKALAWYQRMKESANPAIRAGALVRLARVLRNTQRFDESHAAYLQLAVIGGVAVAQAPAELVARHALAELSGVPAAAEALRQDLLAGRWPITRGQFEFYWDALGRISRNPQPPPPAALALAGAAALVWQRSRHGLGPRGQETVWVGGQPLFLMRRGSAETHAVLVIRPESILNHVPAGERVALGAVDAEGRLLAGTKPSAGHAAIRTAADTQLPWTLYITGAPATEDDLLARQRFLLLGIAVMVLFLMAGTYFIARAIRREMEVSRMQSDFVSAVSHEFRSPLTSMRQLSEILALGRVPSENRRQVYYETLVRETERLQRLVEALLNFGRMEAGARQYRFEELDASELVRRVTGEFERQIHDSGRHIQLHEPSAPCSIEADPEAISVALRNLVDNALKYSPGQPTVWVEWGIERQFVAIRVRDEGPGIALSERRAIFRKFVRGTAAATANVKGSGVGLAMVRHIVDAHGGDITVASAPGHGSTFTMLLPAGGRS